jgi:glycosyltransferase involved in cell wall biosynthesis
MKKPLKIAFDASPLLVNKTGVAYYIERLVTELARKYPEQVELVGFYYNFLGRKSAEHMPAMPNVHYRPVKFIPSKIVYQLRRWNIEIPVEVYLKEKVDFILYGNFLGYPSLRHTASAPVVHDLTYLDLPEYVAAKNRSDLERFVPKEIKRSRFVVTVSDFSKQKIAATYGVAADDVLVTPIPPIPPTLHSEAERAKKLSELGIDKPFVLFVSTIEPRKNVISLIDAYEALPEKRKQDAMLVIVGRMGWNCEAEAVRLQKAKDDGLNVLHVGYVDDETKSILFESATIFSSASYYEGFGMPVLEAMSYSRPCAVSDIQVFHEVAGDAGAYFDPHNIPSITNTLEMLLGDANKRQTLAKQGKARADSFRWDDVATSLFEKINKSITDD